MKRESTSENYSYLHHCNPYIFWKECCMCNKEFRRENGWKALTARIINNDYIERYVCESCAPNRKVAEDIFNNRKYLSDSKPPNAPSRQR